MFCYLCSWWLMETHNESFIHSFQNCVQSVDKAVSKSQKKLLSMFKGPYDILNDNLMRVEIILSVSLSFSLSL